MLPRHHGGFGFPCIPLNRTICRWRISFFSQALAQLWMYVLGRDSVVDESFLATFAGASLSVLVILWSAVNFFSFFCVTTFCVTTYFGFKDWSSLLAKAFEKSSKHLDCFFVSSRLEQSKPNSAGALDELVFALFSSDG